MDKYKTCNACAIWRDKDVNLSLALNCNTCKGKGIVRTRESYICNKCGKNPCCQCDSDMSYVDPCGLIEAKVGGGYSSPILSDCINYTFTLCEYCLRELFDACVIPPTVSGQAGYESYAEERKWYEERMWRASGGKEKKFEIGICNANKDCTNIATWREFKSACLDGKTIVCDEHKKSQTYNNTVWGKISDLLSDGNKELIVKAYLKALEEPNEYSHKQPVRPGMIVYFQFVPECMKDLIIDMPKDDEDTSCLWAPDKLINDENRIAEVLTLAKSMAKNSFHSHETLNGSIYFLPREAFCVALIEKHRSIIWM